MSKLIDLSPAQKRIWFLQKLDPNLSAYNIPLQMPITGTIELDLLRRAVELVVDRQSALRTRITEVMGKPKQFLGKSSDVFFETIDLSDSDDVQEALRQQVATQNRHVFSLSDSLFRVNVYKLATNLYHIHLNTHHIVTDGWSGNIIPEELISAYGSLTEDQHVTLPALEKNFFDIVEQNLNWLESVECTEMEQYWLQELIAPLPILDLPIDYARPMVQTYNGSFEKWLLPENISEMFKKATSKYKVTPYMLMLSFYALFLNKISRNEELIIGYPTSGRNSNDVKQTVGLLINTLCIRIQMEEAVSFEQLTQQVKRKCISAYRNDKYPFDQLVSIINPERDLSRSPIFSTLFQYYDRIPPENDAESLYELCLLCKNTNEQIEMRFEYNTDLFTQETIIAFSERFTFMVQSILENPEILIKEVLLLTNDENNLLASFNSTAVEYDQLATVNQQFEAHAARAPLSIAVTCGGEEVTYSQLNDHANRIAAILRRSGAKRNSIIAVSLKRSIKLMASLLGVLKAGSSYLPIDPEYPQERIKDVLVDSGAQILILDKGATVPADYNGHVLFLELSDLLDESPKQVKQVHTCEDLAYLIYTSGSTGKPKGVMIEHKAVMNFIVGMKEKIQFAAGKSILSVTTISFDIFVLESLLPLTQGMRIIMATEDEQKDPTQLIELIKNDKIAMIQMTPSRMQMLLSTKSNNWLGGVTEIMIGGELFPANLLASLQSVSTASIYNMYGPTETTIWSSVQDLTLASEVTVGKPIANTRFYVVDDYMQIQPIGIIGQLCIAGDGLARGYHQQEELTRQKFIVAPFNNNEIMYQTGDLAKWLPDGTMKLLGRTDHQIKLRGYRIELEDIENHLKAHDAIEECVAVIVSRDEEQRELVGYYTGQVEVAATKLHEFLSKRLPMYMVPAYYMHLKELPLTPNGKVDRKRLPEPEFGMNTTNNDVSPVTEIERSISEIWKTVLNRDWIGLTDNFFQIGGNSILLVQVHAQLIELYPDAISVADLFGFPNIRLLGQHIDSVYSNNRSVFELKPISFPLAFFTNEGQYRAGEIIRFQIAKSLSTQLSNASIQWQVDIKATLLGMFAYLLSEYAGTEDITIPCLFETNIVTNLSIELSSVSDVTELIKMTNEMIQHEENDRVNWELLKYKRHIRTQDSFIPAFSVTESLPSGFEKQFDLVLKLENNNDELSFCCEFNAGRLARGNVEQLLHTYVGLLSQVMEDNNEEKIS